LFLRNRTISVFLDGECFVASQTHPRHLPCK
jgi:hypothetical protein